MSHDEALAEVNQLRQRISLLERMATDPSATPDSLRAQDLAEAARRAGFRNPAVAAKLLAQTDGDPDELVAALAVAEPYMVAAGLAGEMNHALRSRLDSADGQPADMNAALRAGRTGRTGRSD